MEHNHNTDNWHTYFDAFNVFTNSLRLETLIRMIQKHVSQGGKLLETGFGSGATALILADMGFRVTAVDVDEKVVQRLRDRVFFPEKKLNVQRMDMFALEAGENEFDAAYHQGVLEHFSDAQIVQALSEQQRIAKMVVFDVPNNRCREQSYGDERFLTLDHWKKLIGEAGLQVVEHHGYMCPRWCHFLPRAMFLNRGGVTSLLGRTLGINYVFVCKPARGLS